MEVADEIGISQAQVSRLEKNALLHLRRYVCEENFQQTANQIYCTAYKAAKQSLPAKPAAFASRWA